MKKVLVWLTIAVSILCGCSSAQIHVLTGMVAGVTEEGFVLHTGEDTRFITVTEHTVMETERDAAVGDVVTITCGGNTIGRTLYAHSVICHMITGTVTDVAEGEDTYFLLTPQDGSETVRVNLPDDRVGHVITGIPVTVYYNGVRTRSVPPQITAQYVRGIVLQGWITNVSGKNEIALEQEGGGTVTVHYTKETALLTELRVGNRVNVSVTPQMRLSLPAQFEALDILPAN